MTEEKQVRVQRTPQERAAYQVNRIVGALKTMGNIPRLGAEELDKIGNQLHEKVDMALERMAEDEPFEL